MIEIAKENDKSHDGNKLVNYFSDPQIDIYYDVARKFGFYIDENVPWRLVANLNSTAWKKNEYLIEIVDKYFEGGYNIESVFENYYIKPYQTDVDSLKVIAMQFYNSLIRQEPTLVKSETCFTKAHSRSYRSRKIRAKEITRPWMTMEALEYEYGDLFWLRLYMQLRMKEMQIDMSARDMKNELNELGNRYFTNGYEPALPFGKTDG